MNKKAFTLMEIIIAAGILTIFIGSLLGLYSGGSKMGNSAIWLQTTTTQLKNAARQINTSIRKSSYPSCIEFPQKIKESESECFRLHFLNTILCATECADISSALAGTKFLLATEATPGKSGFSEGENQEAQMVYHIFSLASNGDLNYSRYKESVSASIISQDYEAAIPGSAESVYKTTLAKNVESVTCSRSDSQDNSDKKQPIQIVITCVMPKTGTTRSETAVGTPNVKIKAHPEKGGW